MVNLHYSPVIWGILLAAGQGTRFAEQRPGQDKLLQPLPHHLSVLQASTLALARHCALTLVVTLPEHTSRHEQVQALRADCPARKHSLGDIELLCSAAGHQGMGSSLAAAALALQQRVAHTGQPPDALLVALADMPGILPSSYEAIIQALTGANRNVGAPTPGAPPHAGTSTPPKTAPQNPTAQTKIQRPLIAAPEYAQQRGHPVGFHWALCTDLTQLKGDQGARKLLQRHGCQAVPVDDPAVLKDIDVPEQLQDFLY